MENFIYNVVYTKDWLDKLSYTKTGFQKFEAQDLVDFGKEVFGLSELHF